MINTDLSKILGYFLFVAAISFVALTSVQAVNNADIWFHLKIGEHVFQNRTFPKVDLMSHTAAGREWIVYSWGYDVFTYLLERNFGLQSLVVLRLGIALLLFLTLWKTARLLGSSVLTAAMTTVLAFYIISIAWIDRPHLLGNLFVTLLMLILTLYQKGKRAYVYFVPMLLLLWSNIHASLPIAVVVITTLVATKFLENLQKNRPQRHTFGYRQLIITTAVAFLASLISPYHLNIYKYFFKINSIATENIFEWLPLSQYFADPYIKVFLVLLAVSAISLAVNALLNPERVDYFEIGLFLVFTYLAFSALRHIMIFSVIFAPFLARNLTQIGRTLTQKFKPPRNLTSIASVLTIMGIVGLTIQPAQALARGSWGLPNTLLPVTAVDFVDEVKPQGRMYNHFNWGGYLLWRLYPEYQTFIDGRLDMFVPDIYKEWLAVAMGQPDWQQILDKYTVDWIIFPSEGIWGGLKNDLENDQTWCLIFWDDEAFVAAKKASNPRICEDYGYHAITPFSNLSPARGEQKDQAVREYQRAINASPNNAVLHNKLGTLYYLMGEKGLAEEELTQAKETNPSYSAPYFNLGLIAEEDQRLTQALALFRKTIKLNPKFAPAYKKIAIILGRRFGNIKEAKRNLIEYEAVADDPKEKAWAQDEIYKLDHNIYPTEAP